MPVKGIIFGQRVDEAKRRRVKQLRSEMTEAEALLWNHLRKNGLCGIHFRRQQLISGFIADFHCHSAGLVVEIDGEIHNEQEEYDAERDLILTSKGLTLLRIPNHEVMEDIDKVLHKILSHCKTLSQTKPAE